MRWLDLGSGGGFPGAIIAILAHDRPACHVDLVESNRKKAAFLQSTLGIIGAPATVHAIRIEDAHHVVPMPDIVTARALAPLPQLIGLALPWLSGPAAGLFHKGRDYRRERDESRTQWQFDLVEHVSRVDPESRVLQVSNVRRQGQDAAGPSD
jgi:16S rRNA (guanine527-N7)-methyltransferase